eukprot:8502374-Pyramimonas_sp.AAC.1
MVMIAYLSPPPLRSPPPPPPPVPPILLLLIPRRPAPTPAAPSSSPRSWPRCLPVPPPRSSYSESYRYYGLQSWIHESVRSLLDRSPWRPSFCCIGPPGANRCL